MPSIYPRIDVHRVAGTKRRDVGNIRIGGISGSTVGDIPFGRTVNVIFLTIIVDVPCRGRGTARDKSEAGSEDGTEGAFLFHGGAFHAHATIGMHVP